MSKKIRIEAPSLAGLRGVLADSNVDLGCRPVARRTTAGFSLVGIVEDPELDRLNARRDASVRIEVLEETRAPEARLRMVPRGNRFVRGEIPRGLGRKE